MEFVIVDGHTLAGSQCTPQDTQADNRPTPLATRSQYLVKIVKNGHFGVYLGSGRSGSKWIFLVLTIMRLHASTAPHKTPTEIIAPHLQRPDPNIW
jgi:hypothetical protein